MKKIISFTSLKSTIKKSQYNQLMVIIHAMLSIKGRITMLGLSRWREKGGSYRTINKFFHSKIDWLTINWIVIKSHLLQDSVYILAGDEVVVSKSGKKTYGIDLYYSSIQNQVIKSVAFLQ